MAKSYRKCKICGKEYEYCKTIRTVDGVYRWQDVACTPEHGSQYLALVIAARSGEKAEQAEPVEQHEVSEEVVAQPKKRRSKVKEEEL